MDRNIDSRATEALPLGSMAAANASEGYFWKESEGQVVNAGWILLTIFTFWLVIPLIYTAWKMIQTACHSYSLSSQRLRERAGVLTKHVDELELYRVKDISVHQPLLQRLLGRGEVILITSDRSTPKIILSAISNPIKVADLIRKAVEQCRVEKGVREID